VLQSTVTDSGPQLPRDRAARTRLLQRLHQPLVPPSSLSRTDQEALTRTRFIHIPSCGLVAFCTT